MIQAAAPIATADDAGAELHRHLAARRPRQLVGHQLGDRGGGEQPGRDRGAEEAQPCAVERQPAEMGGPADDRRRGHGPQPGDAPDQEGQD
jgi:hypothetical protein